MFLYALYNIFSATPDLKSTDYLIALAMAYFVIKELFKMLNNKKNEPLTITRVTDESELEHRRQMMDQHAKMIEVLNTNINIGQGIEAVGKSTNEKCARMEKSLIIIEDRIVNQ